MRSLLTAGLLLCGVRRRPAAFVVAIGGVMHESNSFNPAKTSYRTSKGCGEHHSRRRSARILDESSNTEISGYLKSRIASTSTSIRPTSLRRSRKAR